MSTEREIFEGQNGGPPREGGSGGPKKNFIANGAIWGIPELFLWIQLAYNLHKK